MLSCDYDDYAEPGDVYWYGPNRNDWRAYDFKRARKCCSCGSRIKPTGFGKDYLEFTRYKIPDGDVEVRIYGEDGEVPRASWFMCFECGWRYYFLDRFGYAIRIYESMQDLMGQHDEMVFSGFEGCHGKLL